MNMPTCDRCGSQSLTDILQQTQSVSIDVPVDLPGTSGGSPVPITVLANLTFAVDLCPACAALVAVLFTSSLSRTNADDAHGLAQAGQESIATSLTPQAILNLLR